MFWLVSFDLARLQGEGGVAWQLTAKRSSELGICFWLPKVILMTVFWTLSLAGYMYIQYTQVRAALRVKASAPANKHPPIRTPLTPHFSQNQLCCSSLTPPSIFGGT